MVHPQDIFNSSISTVPPWLLKPPSVDLSLRSFAKAETIPDVFKSKFLEICDGLQGLCQIYTDRSKTNNGTAAAAVSGDIVKSLRITSHASIFTAELLSTGQCSYQDILVVFHVTSTILCYIVYYVTRSN